ncbi:MAG: hypothetical protein CL878_12975 [Dehalococcoidia bacterium]|nr:hypothetical protein [Dehalococcoidia bacterium]
MLTEILHTLRTAKEPLLKAELARKLAADESALDGMLGLLAAQGRLCRVGDEPGSRTTPCDGCGLAATCGAAPTASYRLQHRTSIGLAHKPG